MRWPAVQGKQLFSVLVRPNVQCGVFVSVELEEKGYTKKGRQFCISDGCVLALCGSALAEPSCSPRVLCRSFVCFRNSELLSGRLGKVTLGSGNKAGLFYALSSDYSPDVAANAMNRLAKLSARWLGTRGFSIGIADVTPDLRLIREKERQARRSDARVPRCCRR
jgi:DNA-directed RNA polymerase III subunit RPC1